MKKIYVLFLLLLSLCTFKFVNIKADNFPLLGKVIYIDPGHGGVDPGAIYGNTYEEDINLSIGLKLMQKLSNMGAIVYMTRYADYDLSHKYAIERKKSDLNARARIINESNADMYISIHLNSIKSSTWYGAQVFYDDVNAKNKGIALLFQEQFKHELQSPRKVKQISDMLLNRKITIPGVLIEMGFLSNNNERYLLKTDKYQDKIINCISNSLIKYYK